MVARDPASESMQAVTSALLENGDVKHRVSMRCGSATTWLPCVKALQHLTVGRLTQMPKIVEDLTTKTGWVQTACAGSRWPSSSHMTGSGALLTPEDCHQADQVMH